MWEHRASACDNHGRMRREWAVAALWCCLLMRLAFYAAALPLWEGFDEWAHFAVIRAMASGHPLPDRDFPLPRDVEASLELAPVPWELRHLEPPSVTQDAFWQLPAVERDQRQAAFRRLSDGRIGSGRLRAYEALQPPLYYWLMTPVLWLARGASLTLQVLLLRFAAVLIASLTLPFAYLAAREFFRDHRLAMGCAAVIALMPEFAFDVARVGNDCLAVTLFTALTWLALRVSRAAPGTVFTLGIVLGLGLITKAYFLTAIPALFLILIPLGRTALACGILPAIPIAAWWYVHNLLTTGTLSGLSESVTLRGYGSASMLARLPEVPWGTAVDSILLSHLWYGGWSGLTLRSWMYHLFYVIMLAALAGCALRLRSAQHLRALWIYIFFWLGQLYNVLLIFLSKGVPTSMGWYLYAVVAAEAILCTAGLAALLPKQKRPWPVCLGVSLFSALDLYTLHAVAIPYYTGMIRHRANGALAAFHTADYIGFSTTFDRLAAFKGVPAAGMVGLWILYLAATVTIVALAFRTPDKA